MEIDYSNTLIYKITCKDSNIKDVYVGHTTNFVQRKHSHKQSCNNNKSQNYKCKLYEVIRDTGGWDNWHMEIIAFFKCNNHFEARKKEQEYFELLQANLNSIQPIPKPKQKTNVLSKKLIEDIKNAEIYFCESCDFKCSKLSNYNTHILTRKHKILQNTTKNNSKNAEYICDCNKVYKHHSSLWNHKKKCAFNKNKEYTIEEKEKDTHQKTSIILSV